MHDARLAMTTVDARDSVAANMCRQLSAIDQGDCQYGQEGSGWAGWRWLHPTPNEQD